MHSLKQTAIGQICSGKITANCIAILRQEKQLDSAKQITDLRWPDSNAAGAAVLLKIPVID